MLTSEAASTSCHPTRRDVLLIPAIMDINRLRPNVLEGLATGLLSLPELEKLMQDAVREELQGIVGEGMLSQEEAASYRGNIVRRRMDALTSREEANTIQEPTHDTGPAQACSDHREDPPGPASGEEVHARLRGPVERERLSREEADTILACFTKTGTHLVNSKAKTHLESPEANTIQEQPHDPDPAQACSDDRENPPGPASKEEVHTRLREPVEQEGLSRQEADTILACFNKTGTHLVNSKAEAHLENTEADTFQQPLHDPGPAQACFNNRENPPGPASEEEVHAKLREPVEQEGLSRQEADTILACFTKTRTHLVNSKAETPG